MHKHACPKYAKNQRLKLISVDLITFSIDPGQYLTILSVGVHGYLCIGEVAIPNGAILGPTQVTRPRSTVAMSDKKSHAAQLQKYNNTLMLEV